MEHFILDENIMSYDKADQTTLLRIAKESIDNGLKKHSPLELQVTDYSAPLQRLRACFVTLNINNQLRGCIGTLEAYRPLIVDVAENAFASAFRDPRFLPVSADEYNKLNIHISILSPPEEISFTSEADLLKKMRPGVDGLILNEGFNKGTFLPSVWEQLPDPKLFLQHLKNKAGLPADYWSSTIKVERYVVIMVE